jgi:predicted  nucleic acid-binding Zn-ribbon protein
MSQVFKLYRLQQIDSILYKSRSRLDEIDQILRDDRSIQEAEQTVTVAENIANTARKALKSAEASTQAQRTKIKNTETKLFGGSVKNPKVLQDLQKESEALRRYLGVIEERQLEAMLEMDDAAELLNEARAQLRDLQTRKIELSASLNGEKSKLLEEVKRQQVERLATTKTISIEDISLYTKLRERRKGIAVAKVTDKSCAACGSTLNSSLLQSARSPNIMVHCETCGRILYAV